MKYGVLSLAAVLALASCDAPGRGRGRACRPPRRSHGFPPALRAELLRLPRHGWQGGIDCGDWQPGVSGYRRRRDNPPRHRRRACLEPRCPHSRRRPAVC